MLSAKKFLLLLNAIREVYIVGYWPPGCTNNFQAILDLQLTDYSQKMEFSFSFVKFKNYFCNYSDHVERWFFKIFARFCIVLL